MIEKKSINLVIADDHPIMLSGLSKELSQIGYTISATAENGAKALELIYSLKPDIAILDIEMPLLNGFEVVKRSKKTNNKTKFIIVTYHKEEGFAIQAKHLGIKGYLLKDDAIKEFESCIDAVVNGEFYFSKSFKSDFENHVDSVINKIKRLTLTEQNILKLIVKDYTSQQIAETLLISVRTVQKHRTNIIDKLDIPYTNNAINKWILTHKELLSFL